MYEIFYMIFTYYDTIHDTYVYLISMDYKLLNLFFLLPIKT